MARIWRREGLKVRARPPRRGRLWLNGGSCLRLRAGRPQHVWAYDFVADLTRDGGKRRMLNVVDAFTRERPAIRVARKVNSLAVIHVLTDPLIARGTPAHVRSDNGPALVARAVRGWIHGVGLKTAFIERGSPWENGGVESFNGKLRDELLNGEVFNSLAEARMLTEQWRVHDNVAGSHSSLGYRPPALKVIMQGEAGLMFHPGSTGSSTRATPMLNENLARTSQ